MKIPLPIRTVPSLTFRAWLTPPPLGHQTVERDRGSTADLTPVYFGGVPGYETGTGPVALALHGWGGRAAQMAPIARRLADEGYRAVIPQTPGHAGGPSTDIKQAASAVRAIVEDVGWPEIVVAHSFASMVLRLAFPEEAPERVALIAPALDVHDALEVFGDRLRLMPWARRGLRKRLEAWDPGLWPTVSQSSPAQLPGANVLIVHDPDDPETPFARSAELAAIRPGTSIVALEGAGHSRILSHPETLNRLAGFTDETSVSRDSAA